MSRVLLAAGLAGLLALILIPALIARAPRWGLLDTPGGRKRHPHPTPLAGLAPVGAACAAIALGLGLDALSVSVLLGAVGIAAIGALDDRRPRSALLRLIGQAACALPLALVLPAHVLSLPVLGAIDLGALAPLVWVSWVLVVVNSLNFIDGLDGLASGVIASAGLGLAVLAWMTGSPAGALICASVGVAACVFALWNLPPAAAFLGDGGTFGLGFLLAGGALVGMTKGAASLSLALPLLVLALPLADASSVITSRVARRQAPWRPDRGHLHHRLLDRGWSPRRVLVSLWALATLLVAEAILVAVAPTHPQVLPIALAACGAILALGGVLLRPGGRAKSAPPDPGPHTLGS